MAPRLIYKMLTSYQFSETSQVLRTNAMIHVNIKLSMKREIGPPSCLLVSVPAV